VRKAKSFTAVWSTPLLIFIAACSLLSAVSAVAAEPEHTGQCYTLIIRGQDDPKIFSPVIRYNDCVVWVNLAQHEKPSIIFTEGRQCSLSIRAKVGFNLLEKPAGCFGSSPLEYGETASLTFSQPGTYKYVIEYVNGQKVDATITVK
jgi:plastocyanin